MNERTENAILIVLIIAMVIAMFVLEHYAIIDQVARGY